MNPKSLLFSTSHNPYFNAAMEYYLLFSSNETVLFVYRNSPSVVIGRCQNPWVECHLERMKRDGVLLVRRISGGGTVYNDLGNCNFSFFSPRKSFDPLLNLSFIRRVISKFGIETVVNERKDLLIKGKKISGSAYRHKKERTMHHCSLLLETDEKSIWRYLSSPLTQCSYKGISSVRSPVGRLSGEAEYPGMECFLRGISEAWGRGTGGFIDEEEGMRLPGIPDRMKEFQEWEWLFGKTPEFTVVERGIEGEEIPITVKWGKIVTGKGYEKGSAYK